MEVNISDYTIREVLSIEYKNEQWRPVAYLLKSLNKIGRNYKIHDEILAMIRGLENWRYLLENTKFKFKVWTNHKNLEYFTKVHKLNHRQAQQALYLSRFNLTLKYILGTKMEKADNLSRRPDWRMEIENNNENQELIKKEQIRELVEVVVAEPEVDIIEKIKIANKKNKVVRVVEKIKIARVKILRGDKMSGRQIESQY